MNLSSEKRREIVVDCLIPEVREGHSAKKRKLCFASGRDRDLLRKGPKRRLIFEFVKTTGKNDVHRPASIANGTTWKMLDLGVMMEDDCLLHATKLTRRRSRSHIRSDRVHLQAGMRSTEKRYLFERLDLHHREKTTEDATSGRKKSTSTFVSEALSHHANDHRVAVLLFVKIARNG
jgi:hypothetical protein